MGEGTYAHRCTHGGPPRPHLIVQCTLHVDMKEFVILQWTEEEQITLEDVPSACTPRDSLSKPTGHVQFYEHRDILMGQQCPQYVSL
jgi:hypothetical protein